MNKRKEKKTYVKKVDYITTIICEMMIRKYATMFK